jgi:hypothetical protein
LYACISQNNRRYLFLRLWKSFDSDIRARLHTFDARRIRILGMFIASIDLHSCISFDDIRILLL